MVDLHRVGNLLIGYTPSSQMHSLMAHGTYAQMRRTNFPKALRSFWMFIAPDISLQLLQTDTERDAVV